MLFEALKLKDREMVCFVGAGGKSSLMLKLALECAGRGARVLVTTSTKMFGWQLNNCSSQVILEQEPDKLLAALEKALLSSNLVAAGGEFTVDNKVIGLSKDCLNKIYSSSLFDYILVEADGSRGKPLKVPADNEPVVPSLATIVLPVMGIEILGCPFTEEYVHRHQLITGITGDDIGDIVTPADILAIIRRYAYLIKKISPGIQLIPILNKVDQQGQLITAEKLARKLLSSDIGKILITSTILDKPVWREIVDVYPDS